MTVREVYDFIDSIAPFAAQEGFDNAGLLVGSGSWDVQGIHVAMDVTDRVLDEAEAAGANLIVTHHPMMFGARKNLLEDDYEGRLLCRMVRSHMALIACHTNWDKAQGGINDVLAQVCGLTNVRSGDYVRVGELPEGTTLGALTAQLTDVLHTTVRVLGQFPADKRLLCMGVVGGAGGEFWEEARAMGADVFLTGEMHHHEALAMVGAGMAGLECGHFATEEPGIFALADALQNRLNALQYSVCVSKSAVGAYAAPAGL